MSAAWLWISQPENPLERPEPVGMPHMPALAGGRRPTSTARILPPSIADDRSQALVRVLDRARSGFDPRRVLMERPERTGWRALPALVREYSIEDLVEPGMTEAAIRDLIAGSYRMHALKGSVAGVRAGLQLIGMQASWRQWWQMDPPGQPGTHVVTVYANRTLFHGQVSPLDERSQRAALRIIDSTKRWSQDLAFQLGVGTRAGIGAASAARGLAALRLGGQTRPVRRARIAPAVAARAIQTIHLRGTA